MVIGDSMVGKTCLIRKFTQDDCTLNHQATVAIDFKIKKINLNDNHIML